MTRAHLLAEAELIRDIHYRPARLIAADAEVIRCLQWLAALPQGVARGPADGTSKPDLTSGAIGAPHFPRS